MGEPGGLPSMRSHRVGNDCSGLASQTFQQNALRMTFSFPGKKFLVWRFKISVLLVQGPWQAGGQRGGEVLSCVRVPCEPGWQTPQGQGQAADPPCTATPCSPRSLLHQPGEVMDRKSSHPLRPTSIALRGPRVLWPEQSLVLPSRAHHFSDQDGGLFLALPGPLYQQRQSPSSALASSGPQEQAL